MKTGIEDYVVIKENKTLAMGYTTGTCAAAAAAAAAEVLLTGHAPERVTIHTPKGIVLHLPVRPVELSAKAPVCAVQKYSGDDPDVTNGVWVYARAEKIPGEEILIDGGLGVGRVTKPGLEQPVGAAAINRVPRKMILESVDQVREQQAYPGGIRIIISIPEGVELAKRTFNPRLGIEGGISVLGTSGIVEPMSEAALIASIETELKMKAANGIRHLLISPGNYGTTFTRETLGLDLDAAVKCSNYVGATIDAAVAIGFESILFVSHIGKFVKVAAGIMNTHSREADARLEVLAAHAALAGADGDTIRRVLSCLTTDEALQILEETGHLAAAMDSLIERIEFYIKKRSYEKIEIGIILFSNERGLLGRSVGAVRMVERLRQNQMTEIEAGKEQV